MKKRWEKKDGPMKMARETRKSDLLGSGQVASSREHNETMRV